MHGIHHAFKFISSSYLPNAGGGFSRSGGRSDGLNNLHLSSVMWYDAICSSHLVDRLT